MAAPAPASTLTCSECAFVNEVQRVYCHQCGAKLDRSVLPKAEEKDEESIEKTRSRILKMTNPNASNWRTELKTLASTLLYAFLLAGLLQLLRTPDNLPGPPNPDAVPRIISSELSEALEAPQPQTLQFSEEDINQYLRSTLRSKAKAILPGARFERAYVRLEPGTVFIGLEQAVLGCSVYSGIRYQVGVEDGQFVARSQGGNIGRIAVHPVVMRKLSIAFSSLFGALKREHGQMMKMSAVNVEQGRITLVTKGRNP